MVQISSKNTDWLLSQWALWAKTGGNEPKGFGEGVMFNDVARLTKAKSMLITDDEGQLIDKIVAKLKVRDREMAMAVIIYHFSERNASHVARILSARSNESINRKRVDVLVKAGTAWVDACLCMESEV
ncbi:antiterminator Q family protein [Psychromonas sp. 14N.309.X.WAT.B.A12]|uniref:antiterminator Q family protein n=1 Tax=Psychromonas sp. 14N.309.X.WAT.B.A12 TaxID=2998322 RepID=UPI0025B0D5E0|nr:antiterminator Q family protein [Psychromonas sp. 14N.309.X.WAT.B.A12]MDN2661829.1 antiterminator Q family protein [Psychromonas sp. 14N.309.X.WAT.B.A12]